MHRTKQVYIQPLYIYIALKLKQTNKYELENNLENILMCYLLFIYCV